MTDAFSELDRQIMQQVLELAARGNATTQPNPRVGCILINGGERVGQGYHYRAGEPHAERLALQQAGERARDAIAYVNLEPCCHQGRTPPCTDALIDAGVKKVIAAIRDPNPQVAGGGFEQLELAGIEVGAGLLADEAAWLNRGFLTRMRSGRPWVRVKIAATLDGRTADAESQSQWITSKASRTVVQHLRASSSAVVTGIDTVLADDPRLDVRLIDTGRQPWRVILDSRLRLPMQSRIIGNGEQVMVFTRSTDRERIAALQELGVEVIAQIDNNSELIDLHEVLEELGRWQCNEVMIETGPTLGGALLHQGLVDEMDIFYGASVLGDRGMPMFALPDTVPFDRRLPFTLRMVRQIDTDVHLQVVNQRSEQQLYS